jgi:hypothetical protein
MAKYQPKTVADETADIKVRIPMDLRRALETAARRDGVSMSLVARRALRAGLEAGRNIPNEV